MTHISHSLTDLQAIAAQFIAGLMSRTGDNAHATVVALSGDLGAGKTAFVQMLAKVLGVSDTVTSPTFVIQKTYQLPAPNDPNVVHFKKLIHIDAYRLNSAHELEVLGWAELLKDPGNLICIEWPERVVECIPKDAIAVSCKGIDETTHEYAF